MKGAAHSRGILREENVKLARRWGGRVEVGREGGGWVGLGGDGETDCEPIHCGVRVAAEGIPQSPAAKALHAEEMRIKKSIQKLEITLKVRQERMHRRAVARERLLSSEHENASRGEHVELPRKENAP